MNDEARQRALKILERRDVSRKMLLDKLTEKGISNADAEEVADWLCGLGVVNDERFAGLVVRHYAAKGYGKRRICDELYRRGIDRELWDAALDELIGGQLLEAAQIDDKHLTQVDRLLVANLRGDVSPECLQRAQGYLLRRGYSWDEIRAATERYLSGKDTP